MAFLVMRSATDSYQHGLYFCQPLMEAAIICIVLFTLTTLLHLFQSVRTRTWIMIPFLCGGVLETVGYTARAISASQTPGLYTKPPFVVQMVLIVLAPSLLAASIYMGLGRIVTMTQGNDALLIPRTFLTKIFVAGDLFAFVVQSGGVWMLTQTDANTIAAGKPVLLVGLFAQVTFFAIFVTAAAIFHFRMAKVPTPQAMRTPWRKHMLALYVVSSLIFIRSIVRCVEFIDGRNGFIGRHEAFLYAFDALPMFIAMVVMNLIHPGEVAKHIRVLETSGPEGREEGFMLDDKSAHEKRMKAFVSICELEKGST